MSKIYTTTDNIEMSQQEYLYGEDVDVPLIPNEVINKRIELLEKHLATLLEVDFRKRDGVRANAVLKALNFWRKINEVDNG